MDIATLASAFAQQGNGFRRRQGAIVSCEGTTVTITIAGSTETVSGVKYASNVCPVPGASVWIDTDGRDLFVALAFGGPAYGKMVRPTDQSVADSEFTPSSFASRTVSEAYGVTPSADGFVVVVPGRYTVTYTTAFASNATGIRIAQITKNGGTVNSGLGCQAASGSRTRLSVTATFGCAVGDVIGAQVYQASGAALTIDGSYPSLAVCWLGP